MMLHVFAVTARMNALTINSARLKHVLKVNSIPSYQIVRGKALRRKPLNVLTEEEAKHLNRKQNKHKIIAQTSPVSIHRFAFNSSELPETTDSVSAQSTLPRFKQCVPAKTTGSNRRDGVDNFNRIKNNIDAGRNQNSRSNFSIPETEGRHTQNETSEISKLDVLLKNRKFFSSQAEFKKAKISQTEDNAIHGIESDFRLPNSMKYEKVLKGNKQFGPVIMAAKSCKDNGISRTILLEGRRLIVDAVNAGIKVKSLYFTRVEYLERIPLEVLVEAGSRFYKVTDHHMKVWSDMVTPPGLMCVCSKPKSVELNINSSELLPITLICDNICDVGQLGSLIRSAAAACCDKVLITTGSIDAWDPQVLRAAAGAHFRVQILENVGWENVANYLEPSQDGDQFLLLESFHSSTKLNEERNENSRKSASQRYDLNVVDYDAVDYSNSKTVLIVNSGDDHSSNQDARKLVHRRSGDVLTLPKIMSDRDVELSQTLTASVVMFEIKRQKLIAKNMTKKADI